MKKFLIPLLAVLAVGVLSYYYAPLSFLLLIIVALSVAVLLLAGIVRAFRRGISSNWVKVPTVVGVICIIGILVGLLRPLEPAIRTSGSVSEVLAYAYKTDQADRKSLRPYIRMFRSELVLRDSIRLDQVQRLYKEQKITAPKDKFYAAFIFHHGKKSALFETAHELASEAAAVKELQDDYLVQWLAKATYDRWMVSLGKPQKYDTQETFSVSVQ